MATRTYNPSLVVVSFSGVPITGFAKGTFITVERNEDTYSLMVGAGGEASRKQSLNRSGKITLTLMATSQANDVLSAFAVSDELSGNAVLPFFMKEVNGTTLVAAQSAWIMKMPKVERADDISTVEWVFEAEAIEILAGGLL